MSTKSRDIWDIADRSGRPSPEGSSLEPNPPSRDICRERLGGGRSRGISGLQLVAVVTPTELGAPGGRCQAGGLCAVPCRRRPLDVESSGAARRLPLTGWTPPPRSPARDPAKV